MCKKITINNLAINISRISVSDIEKYLKLIFFIQIFSHKI